MAKLLRVDKNGTKYWFETKCPKCGGTGHIDFYNHVENGICFQCDGSGYYETSWKEYTPEYRAKLDARRLAKAKKLAPEKNAKFLKKAGFSEDGKAWVVVGNTYEIKEQLKEAGCKWHNLIGWHFDHETTEFNCFEMSIDEVTSLSHAGEYLWDAYSDVVEYVKEQRDKHAPKSDSEFVGNIGDKVDMKLTYKQYFTFETHYSYYGELNFIYKFADENGNTIVWKTSKALELNEGQQYEVKGTIKEHNEYKGDKQTVLTRCKIA